MGFHFIGDYLSLHLSACLSLLTELDNKASNLSMMSQKYKKDARYLNLSQTYAKLAAGGILVFVVVLYFWIL
jgi:vesicle transport protein SEC22